MAIKMKTIQWQSKEYYEGIALRNRRFEPTKWINTYHRCANSRRACHSSSEQLLTNAWLGHSFR